MPRMFLRGKRAVSIVCRLKDNQIVMSHTHNRHSVVQSHTHTSWIDTCLRAHVLAISTLLIACIQGCAHSSLFTPYPAQAETYRQALAHGTFDAKHPGSGRDALLHLLEQGRVAQVAGAFETSLSRFEQAIAELEKRDNQARIRVSEGLNQGAALLTNDNIIPYEPAGYERIYVHHWQAINYLALAKPEQAAVELRRARLEQQVLVEQYEAELADAQAQARKEGLEIPSALKDISGLEASVADLKSGIQSAYTFSFSSAVWEAMGDNNSALVDAKLALEINPDNPQLLRQVQRLQATQPANDAASVWLFVEQGFIASKVAKQISFPNFHGELIALSLPGYRSEALRLPAINGGLGFASGQAFAPLSPISNVSRMAAAHLDTRLPSIYVRQALRALAKQQMQKQVGQNMGDVAKLLTMVYTVATERADLRSWLTLPAAVYASHASVNAGEHTLTLQVAGQQRELPVSLQPGQTLILRAIHTEQGLQLQRFLL